MEFIIDPEKPKKRRGRPPGSKNHTQVAEPPKGMSPLDYMLKIMRDQKVTQTRRDKMALAAAPYYHAKQTVVPIRNVAASKKEMAAESAATAGIGTEWGNDLEYRAN